MTKISNYMNDGARAQSVAVLALLRCMFEDDAAEDCVSVSRYNNGRERGYFLSVMPAFASEKGLTVAFAEDRMSDSIAIYYREWRHYYDQPTVDVFFETADVGKKMFGYMKVTEAAFYIKGLIDMSFVKGKVEAD